jgi:hypothetical protein
MGYSELRGGIRTLMLAVLYVVACRLSCGIRSLPLAVLYCVVGSKLRGGIRPL